MRKLLTVALATVVLSAAAFAGDKDKKAETGDMDAMMKEMEKCMVCSNMAPHMAALMPVMKMEKADLNNGFAMITTISDAKVLATYHSTCDMMDSAGEKAMALSEADAKTNLCGMCQGIYGFVHAGGSFSTGKTATGDLMVFSSNDPKLKPQMEAIASMFSMMTAH